MEIKDSVEKTVEDTLPKRGKMSQALDAILIDQMDEIGLNEISNVQRMMEKTVFKDHPKKEKDGAVKEDSDMNRNLLICDNITIDNSTKENAKDLVKKQDKSPTMGSLKDRVAPIAILFAVAVLGAVGSGLVTYALLTANQRTQPSYITTDTDTDTDTKFDIGFEGDFEVLK